MLKIPLFQDTFKYFRYFILLTSNLLFSVFILRCTSATSKSIEGISRYTWVSFKSGNKKALLEP